MTSSSIEDKRGVWANVTSEVDSGTVVAYDDSNNVGVISDTLVASYFDVIMSEDK